MQSSFAAWLVRGAIGAALLGTVLLVLFKPTGTPKSDDFALAVPAFALTERSGRTVTNADLLGKVWIAGFVFTRCAGPCPAVSGTMARLQAEFADSLDVRLVTFTVDPAHDDTGELKSYADRFGADPERWLFLTGKEEEIYRLLIDGFKVGVQQNQGAARTPGNEVMHSTKLAIVDRRGQLRDYASGWHDVAVDQTGEDFESNLRQLHDKVKTLLAEKP